MWIKTEPGSVLYFRVVASDPGPAHLPECADTAAVQIPFNALIALDTPRGVRAGERISMFDLLLTIQSGVFNLAARMLGNRDDAADATQATLLKVVTHLGSFRAAAAFPTWVCQLARNHLPTALTCSRESPELSLKGSADRLQVGLDFVAGFGQAAGVFRAHPQHHVPDALRGAIGAVLGAEG